MDAAKHTIECMKHDLRVSRRLMKTADTLDRVRLLERIKLLELYLRKLTRKD